MIRFSILVPTRDRPELVESCVRAVLAQRGAPLFELLVIDQSRDNATRAAIERAVAVPGAGRARVLERDPGGVQRRGAGAQEAPGGDGLTEGCGEASTVTEVIRVPQRAAGRSRALNAGWPLARGEWVAIIDDDCEPEPDWLAWLDAEARRAGPRDIVVGRVMPGPVQPGKAFPPATIMDPLPATYAGRVDRDLVYPNIALPRRVFAEIGPFDERMGVGTPLPGGEDNDYGYRLLRAGWRILYRPAPTVVHCAWRTEDERAALKRSYGIGQGAFYAKHLAGADPFIAYRFAHDVLRTARAAAGAAVRGRGREGRGHLAFLRGLFIGAWRMGPSVMRTGRATPVASGTEGGRLEGGLILEMDLVTGDVSPPVLGDAPLAYIIFRWKGQPVGRLLVERGRELSEAEFRSAAFEASAAGILAAAIESSESTAGGAAPADPSDPDSPAAALRRLAALMDLDAPIGRATRAARSRAAAVSPAGSPGSSPATQVHAPATTGSATTGSMTAGTMSAGPASGPAAPARPSAIPAASEVSVVIATRDRPDELDACLAALRALDPPPGEIVVADSASGDPTAVAAVARRAGARLVRLEKAGLSRARNAGAAAASGSILAFLDDDCRVDAGYLDQLRAGFTDDGVWAVTGLLLPLELHTEAQRLFLRYSHMDLRGFLPRRYDREARPSRHWPIDSWRMGSGGNLAVRAARFAQLGGFHAALGLGTPARGGEDLFLLWSIVQGGGAVVFRPGAMARHRHHRTLDALGQVLYGYGAGHAAYLRAIRRAGAPRSGVRFYKMSFYADRAARIARWILGRGAAPATLVLRELRGSMAGGALARRAERDAAQEAAEAVRAGRGAAAPKWSR